LRVLSAAPHPTPGGEDRQVFTSLFLATDFYRKPHGCLCLISHEPFDRD
jgi:hypothetical protein